jgi:hypothetical protein
VSRELFSGKPPVIKAAADWEAIATGYLGADVIVSPAIASSRFYPHRWRAVLLCGEEGGVGRHKKAQDP